MQRTKKSDEPYQTSRHSEIALSPGDRALVEAERAIAYLKRVEEAGAQEAGAFEAAQATAAINKPADVEIATPILSGTGPLIRLIDAENLTAAYKRVTKFGSADKKDREHIVAALKHVAGRGVLRRVQLGDGVALALAALRARHPNFAEVVDVVEAEFALAARTGQPARLPPLLLDGAPGCGKTYFAQKLAETLATGFLRVSLESAQSASDLSGSADYWSNSKPGRLFHLLIEGDFANPVVLLDEVDKAGGHASHRADRSLYQLLDPGTASVWADLAYPTLQVDASYVVWVPTSNDFRLIAAPLLSRMRLFSIQPLPPSDARRVVKALFADAVESLDLPDFERDLPITFADMLRPYSLREVARLSRALIAQAVLEKRNHVDASDMAKTGASHAALAAVEPFFRKSRWDTRQ